MENKVLITGAGGFVGKHLSEFFPASAWKIGGLNDLTSANLLDINLVEKILRISQVNEIIHLAGYNGGIEFNVHYPADIMMKNTVMGLNLLWMASRQITISKMLSTITSCGYSYENADKPLEEKNYLKDQPHHTVACHGYAKRNLFLASMYMWQQYQFNAVCVCPTTLYGPHDNFDQTKSKVVAGLINRFVKAKQEGHSTVECWGSGKPLREIMFVKDAVKYIQLALLRYNDPTLPLNIGSGQEISIRELAELIARLVKYTGKIVWNTSRPDGQQRKLLCRKRQLEILGELPLTSVEDGLAETIEWRFKN